MSDYLINCPKHGLVEAIGKSFCSECFEETKQLPSKPLTDGVSLSDPKFDHLASIDGMTGV